MTVIARDDDSRGDDSRSGKQVTSTDVPCLRSAELRRKLALASPRLPYTGPVIVQSYVRNLQLMHDVTRASVPLMRAAQARWCGDDERGRRLSQYFEEHIREEDGHVELVLADLEELGIRRAYSERRRPNPYVAAAVGAQYYWIAHHSPIALLGYIAFLEGTPPTQAEIAKIRAVLPDGVDAVRASRVHAEADPGHSAVLDRLIDALELSDAEAGLLGLSALQTMMFLEEARGHERLLS